MKEIKKNPNPGVQIITYPDSLGKNLKELDHILDEYFSDAVTGVHILPFYPSSADRGFAPLTHRKINPKFGDSADIKNISRKYSLMADLIVNHVSSRSKYFQDYLKNGNNSKYRNFFIKARYFSRHWYRRPRSRLKRYLYYAFGQISAIARNLDFVFHKHGVNRLILKKIYRPRPGSPFVKFRRSDGSGRYLWCTFSPDQIDLNIESAAVRRKFRRDIKHLAELGARYIRLDAVAYAGKQRGTNNFLIPKTIKFIKWLAKHAHNHDVAVVPEVHFRYKEQLSLSSLKGVDYVYDFSLPFLMLNALFKKRSRYLKNWLKIRPQNSLSNLDTHDGIGVIDVEGLLPPEEISDTCEKIFKNGGHAAMRASGNSSNNLDIYQVNCAYYSALGENDSAYLLARAVQLFLPGIPQIYYVGFLAGANDEKRLKRTKTGRDINRHHYSLEEIKIQSQKKIVQKIFSLSRLRNQHSAFRGRFFMENSPDDKLYLCWKNGKHALSLKADFKACRFTITDKDKEIKL